MRMPKFTPIIKAAIAMNVLVRTNAEILGNKYDTVVGSAGILLSHEAFGNLPDRVLVTVCGLRNNISVLVLAVFNSALPPPFCRRIQSPAPNLQDGRCRKRFADVLVEVFENSALTRTS